MERPVFFVCQIDVYGTLLLRNFLWVDLKILYESNGFYK